MNQAALFIYQLLQSTITR